MSRVIEVPVPVACNLLHALKAVHFCDAYQAPVSHPELGAQDVYRAVFACVPAWASVLFKMRGIVASVLGLRHGAAAGLEVAPDASFQVGRRVGMFSIRSMEPDELIVGDNDRHLDFRLSIFRSRVNGVEMATVSTAVEIHNTVGKIYMVVIKPFHRCITRAMIQKAVNAGRL